MKIALGALTIRLAELVTGKDGSSIAERVEWTAPAGCVDEENLEKAVVTQLHQAPETLARRVRGSATTSSEGLSAVFEVWEGSRFIGKRRLELPGTNCASHTETLSFVLTLLLEGGKVDEPEPSEEPPPEPVKTAPFKDEDKADSAPSKKVAERTPTYLFSAHVGASMTPSLLPGPGVSLGGGLGIIAFSHYSLELFGGFRVPEERFLPSGEGVRLGGGGARLEACYLFLPGSFRLGPCAALGFEVRSAEGVGFTENKRESVVETFPLVLARLEWVAHERVFVRGSFGMGTSFAPHNFVNQDGLVLFSESPYFPFAGISAGATLAP